MKKIIISTLCLGVLMMPNITSANISDKVINNYEYFQSANIKNEDIKKLVKTYEKTLWNMYLHSEWEYNHSHYYTKVLKANKTKIPEAVKNRLKKIQLVIENNSDISGSYGKEEKATAYPIKSEKYKVETKTIELDYKALYRYTFNTSDFIDLQKMEASKNEYSSRNMKLQLVFDTGDTVNVSSVYVSLPSKRAILASISYENNESHHEIYYKINEKVIREYLQKKYKSLPREQVMKKLETISKKIGTFQDKKDKEMKNVYNKIQKDSDFKKYTDTFRKYTDTIRLVSRIGAAVKTEQKSLEAYNIIDSL